MENFFESPFRARIIRDQIKNPNIIAGKYSYYSGYYHGHSFDDCAHYLLPDRDDVDKLIIGSFCSIGSGTKAYFRRLFLSSVRVILICSMNFT